MDRGGYFTKFGTGGGPDVDFPPQVNENFGAQIMWVGEMDPSRQNPLNTAPNLVDHGINDSTVWGIKMGESFGSGLL